MITSLFEGIQIAQVNTKQVETGSGKPGQLRMWKGGLIFETFLFLFEADCEVVLLSSAEVVVMTGPDSVLLSINGVSVL